MKKIALLSIALFALLSCNKEQLFLSDVIQFDVNHTTKVTSSSFEANDDFSLFAVEYDGEVPGPLRVGANFLNNERVVFNGSTWSGARTLYWSSKPCDFYALFPYQKSISSVESLPFSVAQKQGDGGFESSDLMFASATKVSKADGSVALQFKHIMSRLEVVLVKGPSYTGSIPDDAVVRVYNTNVDCRVNFLSGSVEKYAFGEKKTIEMKKIDNEHFEAVVVPQNIERRTPLIELTMGGIAYLLEYSMSFRPGVSYVLEMTLNSSPDQEQMDISIDPSIRNW